MEKRLGNHMVIAPLFSLPMALLLICLRMVLRLHFIDTQTGFVNASKRFSVFFAMAYVLTLVALLCLSQVGRRAACPVNPPHPAWQLGCGALLVALAVPYQALVAFFVPSANATQLTNRLLRWGTLLSSVLAAAAMLWFAAWWLGMRRPKLVLATALGACVVLHRSLLLVESFTRHTTTVSVSEDTLETLLLIFSLLFWVAHLRILSGYRPQDGLRLLVFAGCMYGVTTLTLYLPDLLGAMLGRFTLTHAQTSRMVQSCATAFYCALFLLQALRAPALPHHPRPLKK